MESNLRRWAREPVEVPCTISYVEDAQNASPARIINLSPGGLMLESDQGFIPDQRVSIALHEEQDTLLFEFAEVLTGIVRWSQPDDSSGRNQYRIGVALERHLVRRIRLTEH